jgi:xylulose-5-phosphate/fructose-6-phosphate phosphoketolase
MADVSTIDLSSTAETELIDRLARPQDGEIEALDAWWRANSYLTVGQIYLMDNPLLREPLTAAHIKPRLLGHWGTSPGLSFIYAHASRLIQHTGQQMLYLAGPGHGGPALVAAGYLEGTYSEIYPQVTADAQGMQRLFRQFSAPGGIPSHVSVTTPGSIHEGGELGYVLVHAFGAVMDNPDLIALAVVGDGEAETGPLEGSWKGVSFLNPERDGAVLPILHLNGAKIAGPTVLARKDPAEVRSLLHGHGYDVIEVEGSDLPGMHYRFAEALAGAWASIRAIQTSARNGTWDGQRPRWPLIILRSPKGWTGPDVVDGVQMQGTFRRPSGATVRRSREPRAPGPARAVAALVPARGTVRRRWRPDRTGPARQPGRGAADECLLRTATRRAHQGSRSPRLPGLRGRGTRTGHGPARIDPQARRTAARHYRANPETIRLFCPDETNSNRLGSVFEATDRVSPNESHPRTWTSPATAG